MKPLYAILFTIVLFVGGPFVIGAIGYDGEAVKGYVGLVGLVLAIWAAATSNRLKMKEYGKTGPVGAFIFMILLWPVALPLFLIERGKIVRGEISKKK